MRMLRAASIVVSACALAEAARAQATWKAGTASDGLPGNATTGWVTISGDGNVVAFDSAASNLVANDTNGMHDVFVRDLRSGAVERASRGALGAQADGASSNPALSFDGRFVAFESFASNLVAGDGNGASDVFVLDRASGVITRASATWLGLDADQGSQNATISADGRMVVFDSHASNLLEGETLVTRHVYAYDRVGGVLGLVSRSNAFVAGDGESRDAQVAAGGRFVVFASHATNLVAGDANSNSDCFVRDLATNTTSRVSVRTDGTESQGFFQTPTIDGEGRLTAFASLATDLVGGDSNLAFDVFVHDAVTGATTRESVSAQGTQGSGSSYRPSLSADGTTLVFQSFAPDLVHGDTNLCSDVFVRDLASGAVRRASVATSGLEGDGQSFQVRASADGARVAFWSEATTLAPGDVNGCADLVVHERSASDLAVATECVAKTNSQGCVPAIGASGLPRASGDDAFFVTAARVRPGLAGMLVWSHAAASHPFGGGVLCVASPIRRTPLANAGAQGPSDVCTGTYSFHFSHAYLAQHGLAPGTSVHCQFWSRDPGFAVPNAIGLTDALAFTVAP